MLPTRHSHSLVKSTTILCCHPELFIGDKPPSTGRIVQGQQVSKQQDICSMVFKITIQLGSLCSFEPALAEARAARGFRICSPGRRTSHRRGRPVQQHPRIDRAPEAEAPARNVTVVLTLPPMLRSSACRSCSLFALITYHLATFGKEDNSLC